jgi:hypothetical protein
MNTQNNKKIRFYFSSLQLSRFNREEEKNPLLRK